MRIGVVGGGIMGSGIAQLAATAGHEVGLRDVGQAELDRATTAIDKSLERFVKAERLTSEQAEAVRRRIAVTTELPELVAGADVVIEAVPEDLALKQRVLVDVAAFAPARALLASNTSQLSITQIGSALGADAARFVGLHFFNPPVMMRLVELIRGLATTDETLERAREFAIGLGKEAVVCRKDSPGFITTRAYAALRMECLRMLEEGVGTVEDIDVALRLGFNFPMGPLELSDFNGVDTFYAAVSRLEEAYGEHFRPTVTLRNMVAAGRTGRKSGTGFYQYDDDGNKLGPAS